MVGNATKVASVLLVTLAIIIPCLEDSIAKQYIILYIHENIAIKSSTYFFILEVICHILIMVDHKKSFSYMH
ncbi:hypothetical protein CR513_20285, partial [Mucuna pruriens]